MLIAQVKLPVAIPQDDFIKLASVFSCIEKDVGKRVYENKDYNGSIVIEVMDDDEYYKDECEKKGGTYFHDGQEISSYYVHERPTTEYTVLKERKVILDVDKFYTVVQSVGMEILKCIPIDMSEYDNRINKLENMINTLIGGTKK